MHDDQKKSKPKIEPFICFCNGIRESTINKAIENGCKSVDEVYDSTGAGVGGCGGSCRPRIQKMINSKALKPTE